MSKVDIKGAIVNNDYGWIYDFFGMENATPKKIATAIATAKKSGEKLDVYINSPGGDISAGAEIYASLQEYGNVAIHVIQACSAASVIMCAGHSDITPVGMVMIHNVSTCTAGDKNAMQHTSDVLKTADKSVAAAYTAKTGKTLDEMLDYMNRETWLTAKEAVDIGLCDEITKPVENSGVIPQMVASAAPILPQNVITAMQKKRMVAISNYELLKLREETK